jgi:hypothetical protein
MSAYAKRDSSLLDCLTFPITIAFWMQELGLLKCGGKCAGKGTCRQSDNLTSTPAEYSREKRAEFNIVLLGATAKAEQRVLTETRAFHELGYLFPCEHINLWLIGPEMSKTTVMDPDAVSGLAKQLDLPGNMRVRIQRINPPCVKRLLEKHVQLNPQNTAMVVFNGGFGDFIKGGNKGNLDNTNLMWSWLPDLQEIARSGITTLFTCANDYADVRGEAIVQTRLVGARFVRAPLVNPYHAGSTFRGKPDAQQNTDWFCANHNVYVIQGAMKTPESGQNHEASPPVDPTLTLKERTRILQDVLKKTKDVDVDALVGHLGAMALCA